MATPKIYKSSYPAPVVPTDESFWQFLLRTNPHDAVPDKLIFQELERRDQTLTVASSRKLAGLGAQALRDVLGLTPRDSILLVAKNSIDWLLVDFAALWAGITIAFVNPSATAYELIHYISIVNPRAIFCDTGDVMQKVQTAVDKWTSLGHKKPDLVGLGSRGSAPRAYPQDFITDTEKPYDGPVNLSVEGNADYIASICFSSGTSGEPKGAVLSHRNLIGHLLAGWASYPDVCNIGQREVFYAPLGHIYGVTAVISALLSSSYVLIMRDYNYGRYMKACAEVQATLLRVVPATLVAMVKDPLFKQLDLSSLATIITGGAVCPLEIIDEMQQNRGISIAQIYGMTEGGIASLRPISSHRKAGSVGKLLANVQARIVDEDLNDVNEGESGEVLYTAPTVFMGYKNNDEANAEAFPFKNKWMRTGDVGHIDKDGFLWLTGRKKDLIKYKGNQVSPSELENVLLSHPVVMEAGVCAKWDQEQQTEVPIGYVSFNPSVDVVDHQVVLNDVLGYVNSRVANTKKLRGLSYLETFPKNATGKLMRRQLPAQLEQSRAAKL